jgi:RimJ/RimL family protein N-acetyltransferase
MDLIEINAGTVYLRQLRADDLLDDRGTLRANGVGDPDAHIARCAADWQADTAYRWAIADPPTGALLGEVGLVDVHDGTARAVCWLVAGQRDSGIDSVVLDSVTRFGLGALDLRRIHSD